MIGKAAKFVGHKILNGLGYVGEGIGKAGYSFVKSTIKGDARNPLVMGAKLAGKLEKKTGSFVKIEHTTHKYNEAKGKMITHRGGIKLTSTAVGVGGGILGINNLIDNFSDLSERVGTVDPDRKTATPSFTPPSYDMTAQSGASGDLVFALNANRTGGYL